MHPRLFTSHIHTDKSGLETDITWHTSLTAELRQQIIAVHVASFSDAYAELSEETLGLKKNILKKEWLTKMIESELDDFEKGDRTLATISLHNQVAGFIMCAPVESRHSGLNNDLYIEMLAVKPFRSQRTNNKIQLGLGKQLIESATARFDNANCITLDTRVLNTPARGFYEKLGFRCTGELTFHGYDKKHYTGYEKPVMRRV